MDWSQPIPDLDSTSPHANRRTPSRAAWLIGLMFACGCSGIGKNVDNPVVGPRPPRISGIADSDDVGRATVATTAGSSSEIIQTSFVTGEDIREEDIAARVNGTPIFVSEILEKHRPVIAANEARVSEEQMQRFKRELVRKDLPDHIDQALALDAARKQLKTEQWEAIQTRLDEFFYQKEIPRLMEHVNAKTPQQVEVMMQKQGTSLTTYRRVWANRQLAGQWVSEQLPDVTVTRPELLEEYRQQAPKFTEPEQIKWQECWISKRPGPGQPTGEQQLQSAVADLRNGARFDDIVEKYSSGPRKENGGHWDWAQPDSLSDDKLKTALRELKVNEVGPVLENERGYRLVKLMGRRETRTKPFEDVQNELREAVISRKRDAATLKLIEELKSKAHIETMFDTSTASR